MLPDTLKGIISYLKATDNSLNRRNPAVESFKCDSGHCQDWFSDCFAPTPPLRKNVRRTQEPRMGTCTCTIVPQH